MKCGCEFVLGVRKEGWLTNGEEGNRVDERRDNYRKRVVVVLSHMVSSLLSSHFSMIWLRGTGPH